MKFYLRRLPGYKLSARIYRFCWRKIVMAWRKMRARGKPIRVVLGAGKYYESGWIPTDIPLLDITNPRHWRQCFAPESIDAILAEHVWEHLTEIQGQQAAQYCFQYLKPGGYVRAAVPDGLHPSSDYIEWVKVGGVGAGADDHRVLYTYQSFKAIFEAAGFDVVLYEYFDDNGNFHEQAWNPEAGKIRRSRRFDPRNQDGSLHYTSIILDAIKP